MKQIFINIGGGGIALRKERENVWDVYMVGCAGAKWDRVVSNDELYELTSGAKKLSWNVSYELV